MGRPTIPASKCSPAAAAARPPPPVPRVNSHAPPPEIHPPPSAPQHPAAPGSGPALPQSSLSPPSPSHAHTRDPDPPPRPAPPAAIQKKFRIGSSPPAHAAPSFLRIPAYPPVSRNPHS